MIYNILLNVAVSCPTEPSWAEPNWAELHSTHWCLKLLSPTHPRPAGPILHAYWAWSQHSITYPIGCFGLANMAVEINLILAKTRTMSQDSNSNVTQANTYSRRSTTAWKPGALWPWIAVRKVTPNQQEVVVQSYTRSDRCCIVLLTEQWQETTISFTNSDVFLPVPMNSFLLWRT